MEIAERLEKLKERFKDDNFLSNRGISNQVGIYIFDYDPKDEMAIRFFLKSIKNETGFNAIEHDLYEILKGIIEDDDVMDDLLSLEEEEGKEALEEQIKSAIDPREYIKKMEYTNHKKGDILIVSGVGKIYPFVRVHTLLENVMNCFNDIPVVVFYPGRYDGKTLTLFNKFFDDNHYRSFTLIK